MSISLKYAVVERERRFLIAALPEGVTSAHLIIDRYLTGTRLRLRQVVGADGSVVRKLGHKVRLGSGPEAIACTNMYLDEDEWALLVGLPARELRKRRHLVHRDGQVLAVDEHEDGSLVAEIDDGDEPSGFVPEWLEVVREVTADEEWTGARLAR